MMMNLASLLQPLRTCQKDPQVTAEQERQERNQALLAAGHIRRDPSALSQQAALYQAQLALMEQQHQQHQQGHETRNGLVQNNQQQLLQQPRHVSFTTIAMRKYQLTIDFNPSVSSGPIGLSWDFDELPTLHLEQCELFQQRNMLTATAQSSVQHCPLEELRLLSLPERHCWLKQSGLPPNQVKSYLTRMEVSRKQRLRTMAQSKRLQQQQQQQPRRRGIRSNPSAKRHQRHHHGHPRRIKPITEPEWNLVILGRRQPQQEQPLPHAPSDSVTEMAGSNEVTMTLEGAHAKDDLGLAQIHWACRKGDNRVVQSLLESGANVNAKDNKGWTPLHWACREGHRPIAKLLLENGAEIEPRKDDETTPLHLASEKGHRTVAALLLDRGARVNPKDDHGRTPLQLASENGQTAVVMILFRYGGAGVKHADETGITPLHVACNNGYADIVRLLLVNGAQVNARDVVGRSPLHWVASSECRATSVVKLLLAGGAAANAEDNDGRTPLQLARKNGRIAVVKLLIADDARRAR